MKTILPVLLCGLLAAVQLSGQEYIDYEMFGAAGDGVTDDQESIARAHDVANEKGLPVKVNSGKTYYIGGGDREIVIRTHTDFGEAKFIIDDRTYWGLMASNFCKGITLDNCIFSRFDAHQGVMDVTLKNSVFGHMGTRAVGSGSFIITNCEMRTNYILTLRDDYGSTWDGEVIIRDCILRPQGGRSARIIDGIRRSHRICKVPAGRKR